MNIMIGFRSTTPGNSISCITFIQGVLPIALARPYVEQFVPEGTKVSSNKSKYF